MVLFISSIFILVLVFLLVFVFNFIEYFLDFFLGFILHVFMLICSILFFNDENNFNDKNKNDFDIYENYHLKIIEINNIINNLEKQLITTNDENNKNKLKDEIKKIYDKNYIYYKKIIELKNKFDNLSFSYSFYFYSNIGGIIYSIIILINIRTLYYKKFD